VPDLGDWRGHGRAALTRWRRISAAERASPSSSASIAATKWRDDPIFQDPHVRVDDADDHVRFRVVVAESMVDDELNSLTLDEGPRRPRTIAAVCQFDAQAE
jgi:hypothetical protein